MWTDENYVGKEFFSSLFKAYDSNGNEVLPNDTETEIDNIKAMFGFWTDFYISALGTGGQSTVGLRLAQLADVNVAGVTNGQVLTYNSTTGKWIASTPQSGTDMATVWANLAASGNRCRTTMDCVHTVGRHVVGQTRGASYARNHSRILRCNAYLRHCLLQRCEEKVVATTGTPTRLSFLEIVDCIFAHFIMLLSIVTYLRSRFATFM
jgi:hypothetical protein